VNNTGIFIYIYSCPFIFLVLNLSEESYQYLYSEGNQIHLLNLESFEEIEMLASTCEGGERAVNMLEGKRE
jgi:elongation factor P